MIASPLLTSMTMILIPMLLFTHSYVDQVQHPEPQNRNLSPLLLVPPFGPSWVQSISSDQVEFEKELKDLKDKLSSTLAECSSKDKLVTKHELTAQDAIAGWEKAEAEVLSLKNQLDESLRQNRDYEERVSHLDAALKECMQQLRFVREDQEQRIHDAVMKTSKEFEKSRAMLEAKLEESSKRLAKISAENANLTKTLLSKEILIEDLSKQRTQAQGDFNALKVRLESLEKDNASLKYEVRVLEKELEIRNEEREFNRRAADASHKQHLESAKKISKLESECQRLRVLVRQRLPGPATLAKMKSEVELLGRDSPGRRKPNSPNSSMASFELDSHPVTPIKRINMLVEQLITMEEENKALKEALNGIANELRLSRKMQAGSAAKLSQAESQLEERRGEKFKEPPQTSYLAHQLSVASVSDVGSDDKVSGESWATALISELEHFRNQKQKGLPSVKPVKASDIDLMDDFAEMEKLALVSVDEPFSGHELSPGKANGIISSMEVDARHSSVSITDISSKPLEKPSALDVPEKVLDADDVSLMVMSNHKSKPTFSQSISKIVNLIEGISFQSPHSNNMSHFSKRDGNSQMCTGYIARVFQWKTSELEGVLQHFLHACYDLLNEKADICKFSQELALALEWILNHCFSLQDVSSMRNEMMKHFDWDDSRSENDAEIGNMGRLSNADKLHTLREQISSLHVGAAPNTNDKGTKEELKSTSGAVNPKEVSSRCIDPMKKELEDPTQSTSESLSLVAQLEESKDTIRNLQTELENVKEPKRMVEDQMEDHESVNKDLQSKLSAMNDELNQAHESSSLEVELDNKADCCKELEADLDLQLQLESGKKEEIIRNNIVQEATPLRTDWEITAASEKLAECQETILKLGKQFKALASPKDVALFDKAIPPSVNANDNTETKAIVPVSSEKKLTQRPSLLDRMIAEDSAKTKDLEVFGTNKTYSNAAFVQDELLEVPKQSNIQNQSGDKVGSLAIVPVRKSVVRRLWKKLLCRKSEKNK